MRISLLSCLVIAAVWLFAAAATVRAQQIDVTAADGESSLELQAERDTPNTPTDVLTADQWRRVDAAVDRALKWLAARQSADGSFPTLDRGQPGVTSLCMMAFMSHGHVPGDGEYGKRLERATDFVLACQKQNGLIALMGPEGPQVNRNVQIEIGVSTPYNHAISSLLLSELYGMSSNERAKRIDAVINKALAVSLEMQRWPKSRGADRGGWRYIHRAPGAPDSDLSITGWELMFLRSARNAGFNVPKQPIDEAVAYVQRCYSEQYGVFQYIGGDEDHRSRGMAGAGILALAHAGFHGAPEAQITGEWILRHDFDQYNVLLPFNPHAAHERYHYSLLLCCQGMYQLGGRHWEEFFPRTVNTLLENQQPDGSWPADRDWRDSRFGSSYTTALAVMALGAPNQLLPIFQR